jgi:transcriptional regulator with XRE-family HTH domain
MGGSVVRWRMLGRRLRELRERAGLTLEEAAPRLYWSVSKLSRIENGQQTVDVHGVKSALDLYDAGGDHWSELLELTLEAQQKGWWQAYGLGEGTSYIAFETEATRVQDFTLDYVPGLLQTAGYARAIFASSAVPRSESRVATQVAVRTIRQERLTSADHPLELAAIIDESVLYRAIGGPDVLRAQLHHLAKQAQLPTVTLQVLPADAIRRAVTGSGLTVLSFDGLGEPDIVFVEHALGSVRLEKEADVERARLALDQLRSDALSPDDSLALIKEVADRG